MEKPPAACKDQDNSKQKQQQQQQPQQRVVWDCGSSLYDSFELKSFKRQLDSAIVSSRTNSMPRLSNRAPISHTTEKTSSSPVSTTKKSKISKSLQKFLRSVFRPKHDDSSTIFHVEVKYSSNKDSQGFYNVNVQPFGEILSTIPEIDLEMGNLKSHIDIDHPQSKYYDDSAVVRKTVSERFTKRSMIGVSCV